MPAPVLKTGVPSRVPRVRIPVSPLRQNASKCSVFPRTPRLPRGFFAFMGLGFAPCPSPCPRAPAVQKGETCDNTRKTEWHQSGHLGTTDGTVFRPILGKHRLEKPVHGGVRQRRLADFCVGKLSVAEAAVAGACTRGCSASRDPFWWLCELRILLLQSSAC